MNCRICNSRNLISVYKGKIRNGVPGNYTENEHQVLSCLDCHVEFLSEFPADILTYYQTGEYREQYNNSKDIKTIKEFHTNIQIKNLERIGEKVFLNSSVADVGAGHGCFLDLIKPMAKRTIAIEPTEFFHIELERSHEVWSKIIEIPFSKREVDIVTSFTVIEHVEDPISFLSEIYQLLRVGGTLILSTPNSDNILKRFIPEYFNPFNYRTAHLYYFYESTLRYILEKVGFKFITVKYYHEYDFSNFLFWLKDGKPTSCNKTDYFDAQFNRAFIDYLEKNKNSDLLFCFAVK